MDDVEGDVLVGLDTLNIVHFTIKTRVRPIMCSHFKSIYKQSNACAKWTLLLSPLSKDIAIFKGYTAYWLIWITVDALWVMDLTIM